MRPSASATTSCDCSAFGGFGGPTSRAYATAASTAVSKQPRVFFSPPHPAIAWKRVEVVTEVVVEVEVEVVVVVVAAVT